MKIVPFFLPHERHLVQNIKAEKSALKHSADQSNRHKKDSCANKPFFDFEVLHNFKKVVGLNNQRTVLLNIRHRIDRPPRL